MITRKLFRGWSRTPSTYVIYIGYFQVFQESNFAGSSAIMIYHRGFLNEQYKVHRPSRVRVNHFVTQCFKTTTTVRGFYARFVLSMTIMKQRKEYSISVFSFWPIRNKENVLILYKLVVYKKNGTMKQIIRKRK